MRRAAAQATSNSLADFWRSYVLIGVLTYSMGAMVVLGYALVTPDGPHRTTLLILGGLSLVASVGPFRLIGLRLVMTRWSKVFFTAWAGLTFVFVAVGAVLDGGVRSPIAYFHILPMLFAGLAYSAGTVSLLAGFGMLTILVVGALTPDPSWSTTVFLAVAVLIAGVITATAAHNRDRLLNQLFEAASVDSLTGCLTRGAFEDRLVIESKLARRDGATFSIVMADVDNLKALNDASGHDSGDRALRLLGAVLSQVARESDAVGRLGGDEFVLLLHGTGEEDALAAAGRFNQVLHSYRGRDSVTASLGISTWQGVGDDPQAIVRRADEALYVAKRSGRDQAALWEPPHTEVVRAGRERQGRRPRRRAATVPT